MGSCEFEGGSASLAAPRPAPGLAWGLALAVFIVGGLGAPRATAQGRASAAGGGTRVARIESGKDPYAPLTGGRRRLAILIKALHNRIYKQRRYHGLNVGERNALVYRQLAQFGFRPAHEVDMLPHARSATEVAMAYYDALPTFQQESLEQFVNTVLATSFTQEEVVAAEQDSTLPGLPVPPPEPNIEDFGIPPSEQLPAGPAVDTFGLEL